MRARRAAVAREFRIAEAFGGTTMIGIDIPALQGRVPFTPARVLRPCA